VPLTRRRPVRRRPLRVTAALLLLAAGPLTGCTARPAADGLPPGQPAPVALLMPPGPARDAALMAVDEINDAGGALGRPVRVVDGPAAGVVAAFGCGTEAVGAVRFCPGDAASDDTFSTGSAPNQRVVPALEYLVSQGRTAVHLALGDDPFSRTAGAIVRAYAAATGAVSVVGEGPPTRAGSRTAVLSTLDAPATARFLDAYARAGLTPDRVPVLSLTLSEADLPAVPGMAGHLLAGSYFRSLPGRANAEFAAGFRWRYRTAPSEPVESAYLAVYVWRAMVAKAGSFRTDKILSNDGMVIDAPEGRVSVDLPRRHLYRSVRVGRVDAVGDIRILWEAGAPVRADPELLAYPWARSLTAR
jgi:urea transport system substrate-binding protein